MTATSYAIRDLAHREAGGTAFTLLWQQGTNDCWVEILDERECNSSRLIPVPAEKALDAFYHPYAYAGPLPLAA
jgi:hypothetical protein